MTSLYEIMEAIRNSISKNCGHYINCYGSTMKYIDSDSKGHRYYECISCKGIQVYSSDNKIKLQP